MLPNLKLLRKEYHISQQALADAIQVSQPSINKYENHNIEPEIAVLKRMAETAAQKKAEGHAFRICNLQLYIYKILEMTGLDRAFSFAEGGDAE